VLARHNLIHHLQYRCSYKIIFHQGKWFINYFKAIGGLIIFSFAV
jgi:hypothetical protein